MTETIIFLSLCFFTLGFLCLIGLISFFLNYYFRSKAYSYYFGYILSTALFIIAVFIVHGKMVPVDASVYKISLIAYEPLQILIFFLHTSFVYNAMLVENQKFKRLGKLMRWYTILVLGYILFSLFFPSINKDGARNNVVVYAVSRLFIVSISFVLYYHLIKGLANIYFRYLFAACTLLLFFSLLALWDSTINRENSTLKGFQFICVGYVMENLCFTAAFIYKVIIGYREKTNAEISYQKQLAFIQLESQQQTMQHIGREIHDNVGQRLTLASLYTQQLAYENRAPHINDKIENVSSIINESLAELRQLSRSLTDDHIDETNITELLQQETNKINQLKECSVTFSSNKKNIPLPYQTKNVLLRIVQEFMQNSIKHAACKNILILLNANETALLLHLKDDGKGFETNEIRENGIGLSNMKKRAELIGGTYTLLSGIDNGTQLNITIPL